MKPIKKIALLHSLCTVGKASITNMMPVLSTMGMEACPIPTVVLSTHTGGFGIPAKQFVSAEYIRNCADHYRHNNITFDAIFVGYLGNNEILSAVRYFVEQFPSAVKILDPIMGDHGTLYSNVDENYIHSFRKLLPLMDMVLPNLTEACFLSGQPYHESATVENLMNICAYFHEKNVKNVIITSAISDDKKRGVVFSDKDDMKLVTFDAKAMDFHGTGDVFDAVLIGSYLKGVEIPDAIKKAHTFVSSCIEESSRFEYPTKEGLLIEHKLSLLE